MTTERHRAGHAWRKLRDRVKRSESVCGYCGDPIDKTLEYPHPMSFTVDHIEPVALRPDLALNRDNVRACHFRCNSERGTGSLTGKRRTNSRDW